jgi:hypothetical protein
MSTEMHGCPEERTGIGAYQSMEEDVVYIYTTVANLPTDLGPIPTPYVSSGVRDLF